MTLEEAIRAIEEKHDTKDWSLSLWIRKHGGKIQIGWSGYTGSRNAPPYIEGTSTRPDWTLDQVTHELTREENSVKANPELKALSDSVGNTGKM